MRQVRCATPGCEHNGIVRDVPDTPVVRGVVCRPALICAGCGAFLQDNPPRRTPVETAVAGPPEVAARRTSRRG